MGLTIRHTTPDIRWNKLVTLADSTEDSVVNYTHIARPTTARYRVNALSLPSATCSFLFRHTDILAQIAYTAAVAASLQPTATHHVTL